MAEPIKLPDGRVLDTRELNPGEMLDLMEAAGNASDNSGYLRMAFLICSVAAIDSVPIPMPATKQQVRNLGVRIGNDGMVQLPLLGEVRLAGLSARNASELIRKKYDADYVVNPQIYLDVISYHPRKFSVEGQVGRPGSYAFPGGDAPGLLDAIGIAGGFLPSADRGRITVKRRSGNELRTIPLSAKDLSDAGVQYFQLQPGDDINVGEAKFTIIGQVNRPGTYDFGGSDSLGLLEAVGMAGGFTRIADRGHVVVKRREGDIMRTIKVNVKRLSTDRPDQFDIKTGDVINVGESWY